MSAVVLDASAVLAVINGERGADMVVAALSDARICAVNYTEVISKVIDRNVAISDVLDGVGKLGLTVVDFDAELAVSAAALRSVTRGQGVSLADRACLALADRDGVAVLTGDRKWPKLGLDLDIRLIR